MAKMMDIGHKIRDGIATASPSPQEAEDKIIYPSLHIDNKVPDELFNKNVGHICRLEIVGKIVSKSVNDRGDTMCLEIHKMGYISKEGGKDFKEYDKMSVGEREEYDRKDVGADEEERE